MESVDVRLARMEEGLVRIHDKFDGVHEKLDGVRSAIEPYADMTRKNHDQIIKITRDRVWVFMLCGGCGTAAGILVDAFLRMKYGA